MPNVKSAISRTKSDYAYSLLVSVLLSNLAKKVKKLHVSVCCCWLSVSCIYIYMYDSSRVQLFIMAKSRYTVNDLWSPSPREWRPTL